MTGKEWIKVPHECVGVQQDGLVVCAKCGYAAQHPIHEALIAAKEREAGE